MVIDLNLKSVFFLSQAVAKQFIARSGWENHQHRLNAPSRRHPRALLYRLKKWRAGDHPSAGERVGGAWH